MKKHIILFLGVVVLGFFLRVHNVANKELWYDESFSAEIIENSYTELYKLSADPDSEYCGWLKDKYGVSWQLITNKYEEIMKTGDEEKKKRIMEALLKMRRINIDELENA